MQFHTCWTASTWPRRPSSQWTVDECAGRRPAIEAAAAPTAPRRERLRWAQAASVEACGVRGAARRGVPRALDRRMDADRVTAVELRASLPPRSGGTWGAGVGAGVAGHRYGCVRARCTRPPRPCCGPVACGAAARASAPSEPIEGAAGAGARQPRCRPEGAAGAGARQPRCRPKRRRSPRRVRTEPRLDVHPLTLCV